jgi:hypothetical protein
MHAVDMQLLSAHIYRETQTIQLLALRYPRANPAAIVFPKCRSAAYEMIKSR